MGTDNVNCLFLNFVDDHSRVVLGECIEEHDDYINANYIDVSYLNI